MSKEFLIEIGKATRVPSTGESPVIKVLGSVLNKPGEYTVQPGIQVEVCRIVRRSHLPDVQKVILKQDGNRRRTVLVHHNATNPVIQDLSLTESLVFRRSC